MKLADRKRSCGRIAADFIEREQAVVAIERVSSSDFAIIGPVNCCTFNAKRRTRGALWRARSGLIRSIVKRVVQEIENAVIGGEPVGACPFDGLR